MNKKELEELVRKLHKDDIIEVESDLGLCVHLYLCFFGCFTDGRGRTTTDVEEIAAIRYIYGGKYDKNRDFHESKYPESPLSEITRIRKLIPDE